MLDQAHETAPAQSVFRQIAGESDIAVQWEHHFAITSMGIKVMNFVVPDKRSVIQIVLTCRSVPLGLVEYDSVVSYVRRAAAGAPMPAQSGL